MHATSLLRTGAQYNLDTLTLERQRIARSAQPGYYYFRPEYLEYLADTTISPQRVAVRLNLKPNIPAVALKPYRVGDITVRLTNIKPGPADTFRLQNVRGHRPKADENTPEDTLPDALARTRPALHRGRSESARRPPSTNWAFSARSIWASRRSTRCGAPTRWTWSSTPSSTIRWKRRWRPT